jgi:hypothetical protein
MSRSVQWRTRGNLVDAVLVLDEQGSVLHAIPATPLVLAQFLTDCAELEAFALNDSLETSDAAEWGQLVLARGAAGEVLEVEPELFWHGIYAWFRSRGVDFDAPEQPSRPMSFLAPDLSSVMDD